MLPGVKSSSLKVSCNVVSIVSARISSSEFLFNIRRYMYMCTVKRYIFVSSYFSRNFLSEEDAGLICFRDTIMFLSNGKDTQLSNCSMAVGKHF